jgi:hypothetical protein
MHPIVEHIERTDLVALWLNEIHVPSTLLRYEFGTGTCARCGKEGPGVLLVSRPVGQRKHKRLFLCDFHLGCHAGEHWCVPDRQRRAADRAQWQATWDRIIGP